MPPPRGTDKMKITKRQLRQIIKEEKTKLAEQTLARTESGDPQSYKDFAERLDEVTRMLADLALDYVDSGWLVDGDHSTLANDTDDVIDKAESLAMAAMGLAKSMGEV
jgi:hypothetical protein